MPSSKKKPASSTSHVHHKREPDSSTATSPSSQSPPPRLQPQQAVAAAAAAAAAEVKLGRREGREVAGRLEEDREEDKEEWGEAELREAEGGRQHKQLEAGEEDRFRFDEGDDFLAQILECATNPKNSLACTSRNNIPTSTRTSFSTSTLFSHRQHTRPLAIIACRYVRGNFQTSELLARSRMADAVAKRHRHNQYSYTPSLALHPRVHKTSIEEEREEPPLGSQREANTQSASSSRGPVR